jgi:hypothetical protein
LTKEKERFNFNKMKSEAGVVAGLALFALLAAGLRFLPARPLQGSPEVQPAPQDVKKPKYDYMSTFRSRSTQPLGLKEDPGLKKMLGQGTIRWAIRAGARHVLG